MPIRMRFDGERIIFHCDHPVLAFDHGASTVRFGGGVEEGEAKAILERLRPRART